MSAWGIRSVAGLITGVVLLAVAGCGGSPAPRRSAPSMSQAPVSPALPPRPVELRLDGIDPCSLLTAAQRSQLGVNQGQPGHGSESSPLKGASCVWSNLPASPDNAWSGRLVLGQGADYALGLEPLRTVNGFAATTTGSAGSDPTFYCGMLVDVAPGQSLLASYDNGAKDYPGMNHQLACDKAQQLASDMLSTLRSIKQR
ncbi:MAG TPA: DUF3558 domain-containing protein [Pseudonocardia sp.]|uniref:DUF3558 domain-containing protein n=1 Tax=Pseudonocardia sp. TaxID=60912 RepID=UPI002EDA2EAE